MILTGNRLNKMMHLYDSTMPIEVLITRTNDILLASAIECSPAPKAKREQKTFKWTPQLKPIVISVKQKYHTWKAAGKPRNPNNHSRDALTKAKKELRQRQRQIMARERDKRHSDIMDASENDQQLFYQLIQNQRKESLVDTFEITFRNDQVDKCSQQENWANYCNELATPKELPQFCEERKRCTELKYLLLQSMSTKSPVPSIYAERTEQLLNSLKNNKAADPFGLSAEHMKMADPIMIDVLTTIVNRIFQRQVVPEDLKL